MFSFPENLPRVYHVECFKMDAWEMILDEPTLEAILGRGVASAPEYETSGLDSIFSFRGAIPFKRIAINDTGEDRHVIAATYYALAHRARGTTRPSVAFVTL